MDSKDNSISVPIHRNAESPLALNINSTIMLGHGTRGPAPTPVKINLNLSENDSQPNANFRSSAKEIPPPAQAAGSVNCCRRYLGMGLALCTSVVLPLSAIIVKSMSQYSSFSLALWRFIGVFLFSLPFQIYYERNNAEKSTFELIWPLSDPDKRKMFIYLTLHGIFSCTAAVLLYVAITYMDVADCAVISFSTPVFVTVVAFFVLGEKCGIIPIVCALLTFTGVVVIARPPFLTGAATFDFNTMMGVIFSSIAMICSTGAFVILRFLRKLNFAIVTSSFGAIGIVQCALLCTITGRFDLPQNSWDWILSGSIGFLSCLGQFFITLALKFESAGSVSLIRTCDVIFAFLWQWIFLTVYPDEYSCVGALIIITGVLIVGFRKWVEELDAENVIRKNLWFVLL